VDLNPDPDVVEIRLRAAPVVVEFTPGTRTRVWAYNGQVPGPLIEARVGDTLIVHLENHLPEATTIHWHGVEVPANMDGSNISQHAVPPGGTFRYEFRVLNAATYWYHPHQATNEQVERGLHGPLIFRDPLEDERLGIPRKEEHTLVVDDVLLDGEGQIEDFPGDPGGDLTPLENAEQQLNGREGNLLLVNGRNVPTLIVRAGVPQRFRIINAANGRGFLLSVPGQDLWRIGGDQGLLDEAEVIEPLPEARPGGGVEHFVPPFPTAGHLLTPSERADLVFVPRGKPGDELTLRWHDFGRGRHTTEYDDGGNIILGHILDDGLRPSRPLLRLRIAAGGAHARPGWQPPSPLRLYPTPEIEATPGSTDILPVFFGHGDPDPDGNVMFFAAVRHPGPLLVRLALHQPVPLPQFGPMPFPAVTAADAPTVEVGETRIWEVVNFTGGDHNFHTHGFPFQLLEYEFVDLDSPANNFRVERSSLELKDTIRLPRRQGAKGRSWTIVRVAARFDDSIRPEALQRTPEEMVAFGRQPGSDFSGGWLAHCHLLEHSARGMMTFYNLVLPGQAIAHLDGGCGLCP
jgi:FtsP/CotA-like multicopper oxidase with cupredoxin domain